ncbi:MULTISPECIES: oxygen-independent coproporphyrinogen III oxidase [Flavobacteriaceae]|uniref:Coproporphyrinogen-III oxidase n=2 Tax=Flavobacteriaceae TaxID=49546 RepID=A0A4Y8AQA9_9FLAO|nr:MULTISPECIES: oxygen-independent coproporphyrinogen III oxidase [Flavobacteriaceae]TEW72135.1 oxygen-independent coproporphyrinogen III oxidase [Gramella jeungdoensis]GGK56655.1 coproporphyrinogen-III oxidase [Lutibacter litoralis]
MKNLIQKYNIPGPRYTSYPTVPFWDKDGIAQQDWERTVKKSFDESNEIEGISLYIHLPFCESLCTFCACHKKITKRHEVEEPYLETVLKEWDLYCDLLVERPKIREIHLGGGTPTYFSSENLKKLINGIFKRADKFETFDFSYEGHPNHTTEEQLQTLYDLGSRRNSFGIQDYDPIVQKAIHRIQSFEQVKRVNDLSRKIGYESISHDLIFGLPFQTEESIRNTIKNTIALKPDRIAYYSYAHVPWIKGVGQRGFDENDLPKDSEKRHLYELGKQLFFDNGYVEIGMDHFALPSDSLHKAMESRKLHRNFMGYTAGKTELMIGLGMSSISDSWYAFAQNEKTIEDYTEKVNQGIIPIFRGHLLTETDLIIRKHILNLMCNLETEWKIGLDSEVKNEIVNRLQEIIDDGLIEVSSTKITVKEEGRMFVRNICMAFDLRLLENRPETRVFSMTI